MSKEALSFSDHMAKVADLRRSFERRFDFVLVTFPDYGDLLKFTPAGYDCGSDRAVPLLEKHRDFIRVFMGQNDESPPPGEG